METIDLREGEPAFYCSEVLSRASPQVWSSLGLTVDRRFEDSPRTWRVRADRYVGIAEFGSATAPARVRIAPKLDADLFLLADWAFGRSRDLLEGTTLQAHVDVLRREPAACLIAWYLDSLEAFVIRWLRRNIQLREDVLVGRVRGRILVTEYARHYVSAARSDHVPCQFLEPSQDTLQNRILRRALHEVGRLIPSLPVREARRHLASTVRRIEPFLVGVTNQAISLGDFKRLRLGRSQLHYAPILRKSEAILSGLFVAQEFGVYGQRAFLWDASILFQEAVRGVLSSWQGARLDGSRGSAALVDHSGKRLYASKVDPDFVLRGERGTLVLDAKWKDVRVDRSSPIGSSAQGDDVVDVQVTENTSIRLRRSDVYQAVAYAHHQKYSPCETGLVYPIVLDGEAETPPPMRVNGFGTPVWIFFIDTGPRARANFERFFASIEAAWEEAATVAP